MTDIVLKGARKLLLTWQVVKPLVRRLRCDSSFIDRMSRSLITYNSVVLGVACV